MKTNLLHPKRILHLLPKVYRKFRTSFLSEPKPQFRVFFGKDSFLITQSHFRQAYCKTQPWTFLVNGGVPIFTIALFMQKFPISSSKSLVCFKIFLFSNWSFQWYSLIIYLQIYHQVLNTPFHMPDGSFWILPV